MSNHPPHMKGSPSAFIQFCEYNGNMGQYIENFDFPVCNKFRPSLLYGEICNLLDINGIQSINANEQPSIEFLLDYNEDRQYNKLSVNSDIHQTNSKNIKDVAENNAKQNEAMLYIETLGKPFQPNPQ